MGVGRREFVVGGGTAALGLATIGTAAAQERVRLRGRLLSADGRPLPDDNVSVNAVEDRIGYVRTDGDGRFEAEVQQNTEYFLGFYKSQQQLHEPVRDGVPHVWDLGKVAIGRRAVDMGDVRLPTGYLLDVRVTDGDGQPIEEAVPNVYSGPFGGSSRLLLTDADGYLRIKYADFTGIELRDGIQVVVEPPEGSSGYVDRVEERLVVDGPKLLEVNLATGGTTLTARSTPTATPARTPTETTAGTGTATPTSTAAATPTRTRTATASATPTDGGTPSPTRTRTRTPEPAQTPTSAPTTTTTAERAPRGFFTSGDSTLEALEDPFVLTAGGFALSVVGILYQLLREV